MNNYIERIPPQIKVALDRWANMEGGVGDFLTAVLENNLMEAVGRADHINKQLLPEICMYVYNEMPSTCHGSPEKVKLWLEAMAEKLSA